MFWTTWLLIVATLIFISSKINFVFQPLTTFVSTLFTPILVAGFLYYLLNPLINLLEKINIKRKYGIIVVLLLFLGSLFSDCFCFANLVNQIGQLIASIPSLMQSLEKFSQDLVQQPWLADFNLEDSMNKMDLSIGNIANSVFSGITTSIVLFSER